MPLPENTHKNELYQIICENFSVFKFIQENALEGLFLFELEDLEKFWIDPKLYKTLGYDSKNNLETGSWETYFFKEDLEYLKSIDAKQKDINNHELDSTLRLKHASGSVLWVQTRHLYICGQNGSSVKLLCAISNIGYEVQKNSKLSEQVERYRHIIDGTNIGVWEWNFQTGETIFNEQWANIVGYTLDDLKSVSTITWKNLLHPDDDKKRDKILKEHLEGRTDSYECELRMKHKNGEWIWVKDKGKVVTCTPEGKPEWITGFQEEITETKERLLWKRTLIENAPSAIAMFDKELNYIAASNRWLEDYNIAHINVIGKNHYEIFPEFGEDWKEIHQRCLNGEILKNKEEYFKRENGKEIWLQWEVRPWYKNENEIAGLIMYTADVTQTKKLEIVAKEKQDFLKTILRNINVGIISCDHTGKLTLFNEATRKWHGLPAKDIPPSEYANYYGLYRKDGETPLKTEEIPLLKTLYNGSVKNEEIVIKPNEGPIKNVEITGSQLKDDSGNISGAVIAMHDITQRKKVEHNLKNTISKIEAILGASTQTMIIGTDINGTITFYNKGAENLLGYSRNEMVGKGNPGMFHIKEELIALHKELADKTGKSLQGFGLFKELVRQKDSSREWTLAKKDGTRFPVQLTITVIKMEGEIVGYLGVGVDISELKKAEKEIKSILKITQNQNERLRNFAHIVSHNLRSHSGNIEMLLNLFLEEHPKAGKDEMMIHLNKASSNLKETIAHLNEVVLMNVSVKESLSSLNLSKYIDNAIENLNVLAEQNNVQIVNNTPKKLKILGIPAYLDSIILNFISNAIKYKSPKRPSFVELRASKEQTSVLLEIEDNGLGIDLNKHRRKLFGMYKTFHSHKDSRGIGLFISKNQIEAMGGKIEVESKLGEGTTFKIYFKYEKN